MRAIARLSRGDRAGVVLIARRRRGPSFRCGSRAGARRRRPALPARPARPAGGTRQNRQPPPPAPHTFAAVAPAAMARAISASIAGVVTPGASRLRFSHSVARHAAVASQSPRVKRLAHRGRGVANALEAIEDVRVAVDVPLGDLPVIGAGIARLAGVAEHQAPLELAGIDIQRHPDRLAGFATRSPRCRRTWRAGSPAGRSAP